MIETKWIERKMNETLVGEINDERNNKNKNKANWLRHNQFIAVITKRKLGNRIKGRPLKFFLSSDKRILLHTELKQLENSVNDICE